MPPKTADFRDSHWKRNNAVLILMELFKEFEEICSVKPQLERL